MSIREGPEELTLRTEEVHSQKSCINVDHIAQGRWSPSLVDADWRAFCLAIYKGVEGGEWEELYDYYKEMSRAAGVGRGANQSQKAKALWKMKEAKDREEKSCDPERKDDTLGRNRTRLELWEEHQKDPIVVRAGGFSHVVVVVSNGLRRLLPSSVGEADL